MKNRIISIGIVGLLVIGGFVGLFTVTDQVNAAGPTYVSGSITSDTTWYLIDSPYIVIGDVTVEPGITLTIEPGVEVKFDGAYSIIVDGKLYANGTSINKIKFKSNQTTPAKGDWYTIRLRTEYNFIDYAEVEYATYGVFMTFFGGKNAISNTTIKFCKFDGIYITNSDYNTISDCTIATNDRYGITIYDSDHTKVKNSIIQYNIYFGINLNASRYTQIQKCNISHNDGKGILLYSNSHHTTVMDCELYKNNNICIDISGTSNNNFINTKVIANNGIGIDFGGATTDQCIDNCDIVDNEGTGIDLKGSSHIDITNCNVSKNKGNGGIFSGSEVAYINITNCEIWNNFAGNGIEFFGSEYVKIKNCIILENYNNGMSFNTKSSTNNIGTHNTIKDSTICRNGGNGIQFYIPYFDVSVKRYIENNLIENNNISQNSGNGIFFYVKEWTNVLTQNNIIKENHLSLNGNHGIYLYMYYCYNKAEYNEIYYNSINNNINDGIYFYAGYHAENNYNDIHHNSIYENGARGIHFETHGCANSDYNKIHHNEIYFNIDDGIYIYVSTESGSSNNGLIYSNHIFKNGGNGLHFYAKLEPASYYAYIKNNQIYFNSISNNSKAGIYLLKNNDDSEVAFNNIHNNTILSNADGVFLSLSSSNTFRDNHIQDNSWAGINLTSSSSDNDIENNYIISNKKEGILIIGNSNNNLITRNVISSNSEIGLKIISATGNQIHHNNFKWNTQNAYDSTISLNNWDDGAEGNYWSDYTGLDDDGDGFGEDPYVISGGGSRDWHPFMNPLNIGLGPFSYEIPLTAGWNLISLPLIQSYTDISSVLSSIAGNYDIVWWYNASDKKWHSTDSDLTDVNHYMGLWIHMKAADTLIVKGNIPSSTSIQLYKGWNLVGNPSSSSRPIDEILAPIIDKCIAVQYYNSIDNADHWKHYHIGKPSIINDLTYMTYGCGYWIYVKEDCNWQINNI